MFLAGYWRQGDLRFSNVSINHEIMCVYGRSHWYLAPSTGGKQRENVFLHSIAYVFLKDVLFRLCNRWLKPKDWLWPMPMGQCCSFDVYKSRFVIVECTVIVTFLIHGCYFTSYICKNVYLYTFILAKILTFKIYVLDFYLPPHKVRLMKIWSCNFEKSQLWEIKVLYNN